MAFFMFWFLASAVISSLEHSEQNKVLSEDEENKRDVGYLTKFLKERKESFENETILANQLERIIQIMDESPHMPRLWGKMDGEMALVQHKMIKTMVEVVKDEFVRIKKNLKEEDTNGRDLADRFVKILSEDVTVAVFRRSGEEHMKKLVEEEE